MRTIANVRARLHCALCAAYPKAANTPGMRGMETKDIPLDNLLLDPNNYRLQEVSGYVSVAPERFQLEQIQKTTLQRLQQENLKELQKSIVSNGFLPIERIVVAPYEQDEDKYLVIEGNRRVAALKSLREQERAGIPIPSAVSAVFDGVPCIVVNNDPAFPVLQGNANGCASRRRHQGVGRLPTS